MSLISKSIARRIAVGTSSRRVVSASFYSDLGTSSTVANNNNEQKRSMLFNPILIHQRSFRTRSFRTTTGGGIKDLFESKPGSKAFAECETSAIQDLFYQFAQDSNDQGGIDEDGAYLCLNGIRELLNSIGEKTDDKTIMRLFQEADSNNDGKLHLDVRTFFCRHFIFELYIYIYLYIEPTI